jgi:hypothetical protein
MAINIKSMKVAMGAASAIPPGWNYSAMRDGYDGPNGEYISKTDITVEGSFVKAFVKKYGATGGGATSGSNQIALPPGANGPAGPYTKHSHGHIAPTSPNVGDMWTEPVTGKIYVYAPPNGWVVTAANAANPFMNAPMATNIPNASITNGTLSVGKGHPYAFHESPTNVIAIETKLGRVSVNIETGDITIPVDVGRDDAIREFWLGFQKHFIPSNKAKYEEEIKFLKRDLAGAKASAVLMKQESEKEASKRVAEKVRKKYGNEKFIMVKPEDLIKFIQEG